MFLSRLSVCFSFIKSLLSGGGGDYAYRSVLFFLLACFLFLRVPYIFGLMGYGLFLFFIILPLFSGLFLCRVLDGSIFKFFSSLVPSGTPLWMAPFVCLAETLSYLVRPAVLMMRPFVNISMGSMGGYVLGLLCFSSAHVLLFLVILFFYEIFVAVVHWFIVCNILAFSEEH
uniref:ATPase subunit 6 n=1 Tax=Creptotrematina aguirrepequenoi TaxID=985756 RepID=UPI0030016DC4|nr:ATPase subunit 6 [Creptotrematina aguirrepequenoi]